MRGTTAPRLHLELMCARVLLPGADVDDRGVHARLDRLERRLGVTGSAPAEPTTGATPVAAPAAAGSAPPRARPAASQPVPTAAAAERPAPPAEHPTPPESLTDAEPKDLRGPSGGDSDDTALGAPPAPAAAPPPAQAVGQPPQLTVTDVRRLWPEVLEEVKGKRRFTWILLSQNAQVAELRNGTMVLAMANVGARDSFSRGGSEDVLREALVVVLGADFRIETMVEGGPSDPPSPTRPPPVEEQATASWNAPAPAPVPAAPSAPATPEAPARPDPQVRDHARQQIRPTRQGPASTGADDERDAAATRQDSDLEETTESHTELLARHLGAEIIAEEEERA
jgi:DNA polymerase-3 subunit gamma/tau